MSKIWRKMDVDGRCAIHLGGNPIRRVAPSGNPDMFCYALEMVLPKSEPSFARAVRPEDHRAVDDLLLACFNRVGEARLVRELREQGLLYREIIMPVEDRAAGYLALSRLAAPNGWFALGPVAIHPDWQRQGRGQFIVRSQVEELVHRAGKSIVVLGHVPFYRSAGFSRIRARRLRTPYSKANTMIAAPGADIPQIDIAYPPPFQRL